MINVIKAQKYQVLRSTSTYVIFILSVMFMATILFSEISDEEISKVTGSLFASYIGEINSVVIPVIIMIYTAMICGGDLSDKTVNYEMLSGIKRRDVFFGRFFVVLTVNILVYIVITALPMLTFSCLNGWGHTMAVKEVLIRYIAGLLPLIRFTSFYTFLTFLMHNRAVVISVGYILSMVSMLATIMINELFDTKIAMYLFSIDTFDKLLNPKNMGYGFFNGEDVLVVKDIIEKETLCHAAAAGIIGTAVFLILGLTVMRKRDMN
ncbi:MAG: hypothetical protein J5582_12595 [Ruminococcus sp.]|uniref:hypothetical protein n=1 Tax=Ruminococcus sp. TaxID=41978 RepID=UPI0025E2EDA2|nr:hypothetical protein [Ruminococcus sp.]MBO4867376.1 hypothetical protein [Ruminococcus sp.]